MHGLRSNRRAAALATVLLLVSVAGAGRANQPVVHQVEIHRFRFVPDTVAARPGDRIVWVNRDIVPHTVTSRGGEWDSGHIDAGGEWTTTVSAAGEYFCKYHPAMVGTIADKD